MIVIAKVKAQGVKRGGCVNGFIQIYSHFYCSIEKLFQKSTKILMALFDSKIDSIYFLQFRLILNWKQRCR